MKGEDETVLLARAKDGVSLKAVLAAAAAAGSAEWLALLYAPGWCALVRLATSGQPVWESSAKNLEEVYEARVFGPRGEFRWLARPEGAAGEGRAAFLWEGEAGVCPELFGDGRVEDLKVEKFLTRPYVLWGKLDNRCRLVESRVGQLPVPRVAGAAFGKRLAISAREYVVLDAMGNALVREEILTGLEVVGDA